MFGYPIRLLVVSLSVLMPPMRVLGAGGAIRDISPVRRALLGGFLCGVGRLGRRQMRYACNSI
jgi:hypothetical protein